VSGGRRGALLEALGVYRVEHPNDELAFSRVRSFLDRADPFRRSDPEGHVTASGIVARPSGEDGGALAAGAEWFTLADVGAADRDGSLSRAVRKAVLRLPQP
jgi:hypothetical protein